MMTVDQFINRKVLRGLLDTTGGDLEFLTELMQDYFDDSYQQMEIMKQALDSDNAESFRRAAHSMKSNSANFGATTLTSTCKEMEEIGKSGKLREAHKWIMQASAEFEQVKIILEDLIGGGKV